MMTANRSAVGKLEMKVIKIILESAALTRTRARRVSLQSAAFSSQQAIGAPVSERYNRPAISLEFTSCILKRRLWSELP